ncbi:uncharacterized protein LOC130222342 [Danio aesculapii]|uniref:uncharacterized protein LOC130222342 n=1 Tax=Danio aesculapii TaxID=1142201 RepID=UPI0024C0465D|nr:uncharacterized protein LOC130222342 [Danio aesculapii]
MANNTVNIKSRINDRRIKENFIEKQHVSTEILQTLDDMRITHMYENYLHKNIQDYPTPIEFHITEVAHITNKISLPQIWRFEGFKGLNSNSLSWWSLKINDADIQEAEERYLETKFPDRSKEERAAQQPFLRKFTTSPLFKDESRYGNFRFTFPLSELMEAYKKQKCEGEEPVLRIYETKLFKQEIEYVVLVHSPQFNEKFKDFPLLTSNPIVAYDGQQIIWKAQAICETHTLELETIGNMAVTQRKERYEHYVWDQVSLAFHTNEVLTFSKKRLKASLSACQRDQYVNLDKWKNTYVHKDISLEEAEKIIENLQDDEPEEEKEDKKEEIKMEDE